MQELTSFGQELRLWRKQRGLTQLELAVRAGSSARHISFIETGRSRPGQGLVLRLSECMNLPIRDRNVLLELAGLQPAFQERDLGDAYLRPFRMAIDAILGRHDPFPGSALDALGRVVMTNRASRAFFPGLEALTPEQSIDQFLSPTTGRAFLENWEEVAFFVVDRMRHDAMRTRDPRLAALTERALGHLSGIQRPSGSSGPGSPVVGMNFRVDGRIIRTFTSVMRFETAREITIGELRLELMFPMDQEAEDFFNSLAEHAPEVTQA